MPALPSTSVSIGWCGRMRVQPTSAGIGGDSTQSRFGKPRMPVSSVRRTRPVGIASGHGVLEAQPGLGERVEARRSRARVCGLYAPM